MLPVSFKEPQVDRPELGRRERMRVEFRLPLPVAEAAYHGQVISADRRIRFAVVEFEIHISQSEGAAP